MPRVKRPGIRIVRMVAGAIADAGRRAVIILPMVAVAFVAPWMLFYAIGQSYWRSSPSTLLIALGFVIIAQLLLGNLMQSVLVEAASMDLRRIKPNWSVDLVKGAQRFAGDLGLNVACILFVALGTGAGAAIAGIACGMTPRKADFGLWASGGAVLAYVPAVLLLSRWAATISIAHIEGEDLIRAMGRSARMSVGQNVRITLVQGPYLAAWPAILIGGLYAVYRLHLRGDGSLIAQTALFALLGVLAALEALGKVRLYRELAAVEGVTGARDLAEVFD